MRAGVLRLYFHNAGKQSGWRELLNQASKSVFIESVVVWKAKQCDGAKDRGGAQSDGGTRAGEAQTPRTRTTVDERRFSF